MNTCLIKYIKYTIIVGGVAICLLLELREPILLVDREHTHDDQPLSLMDYRYNAGSVTTTASTIASGDFHSSA